MFSSNNGEFLFVVSDHEKAGLSLCVGVRSAALRQPPLHSCPQMFVRLFVDENLDRHVPISKQPKEKIQAIMDSCTRQFPEYAERARKRIRTYLKSCRRTKRSREQAGLDINNVRWRPASSRYCEAQARVRQGLARDGP